MSEEQQIQEKTIEELKQEEKNKVIEALAELEHEQWQVWTKDLISKKLVSDETKERWEKLFVPYSELTEDQKEHDRVFAREVYNKLESLIQG